MKALLGILAAMVGLAGGAALGILLMMHFANYHFEPRPFLPGGMNSQEISSDPGQRTTGPITAPPKRDLVLLVMKLDQLLAKPPALNLGMAQRKELFQQLTKIESVPDGDESKQALHDLLKIVEADKEALETAGFAWSGAPALPTGDAYRKHLHSLRERLKQ